jgi:hypothetical protein
MNEIELIRIISVPDSHEDCCEWLIKVQNLNDFFAAHGETGKNELLKLIDGLKKHIQEMPHSCYVIPENNPASGAYVRPARLLSVEEEAIQFWSMRYEAATGDAHRIKP